MRYLLVFFFLLLPLPAVAQKQITGIRNPADPFPQEYFDFQINGVRVIFDPHTQRYFFPSSDTGVVEFQRGGFTHRWNIRTHAEWALRVQEKENAAVQENPLGASEESVRRNARDFLIYGPLSTLRSGHRKGYVSACDVNQFFRLLDHPFMNQLELTDEQRGKLSELVTDHKQRLEKAPNDEWRLFELQQTARELNTILLPHQLTTTRDWSIGELGVVKTLTETPIGESIGLTEREQETLRTEADREIEALKKQIAESRQRIRELYEKTVDMEQREAVEKLLGDPNQDFLKSTPAEFIRLLDYPEDAETNASKK